MPTEGLRRPIRNPWASGIQSTEDWTRKWSQEKEESTKGSNPNSGDKPDQDEEIDK